MHIDDVTDDTTVGEARLAMRAAAREGTTCVICQQSVKVYRRPMTSATVRLMIAMYREVGTGWVQVPELLRRRLPDVATQGGYATLAHWWGLIEPEIETRRDDGGRVGFWRVTPLGQAFLTRGQRVQRYALIYNSRLLGYDGEAVDVQTVLGSKFDLGELMSGVPAIGLVSA